MTITHNGRTVTVTTPTLDAIKDAIRILQAPKALSTAA